MLDHHQLVMTILFLVLGGLHLAGIFVMLLACRNATRGREDQHGFHVEA